MKESENKRAVVVATRIAQLSNPQVHYDLNKNGVNAGELSELKDEMWDIIDEERESKNA